MSSDLFDLPRPFAEIGLFDGKTCSICKEWKPFTEFHRLAKKSPDGFRAACRLCTKRTKAEQRRKRLETDPDYAPHLLEVAQGWREQRKSKIELESQIISEKKCRLCDIVKPLTSFYPGYHIGGRKAECSSCMRELKHARVANIPGYRERYNQRVCRYFKQRYHEDPEFKARFVLRRRAYLRSIKETQPERWRAFQQERYQRYCEHTRAYRRKFRWRDNARKQERYATDPTYRHKQRGLRHKRRLLLKQNGGTHTYQEWADLCEQYGNLCLWCKEKKPLTVDHVIPLSKGGTDDIGNLQPLCFSCNSKKQARAFDFRPVD